MQHTKKYQLNLIETSDTFSPAPLNENMERVEAEMETETAARQAGDAALDQRLQVVELHGTAADGYIGDGSDTREFHLGFAPIAVLTYNNSNFQLHVKNYPLNFSSLFFTEDGFYVSSSLNSASRAYQYLAIG